MADDSGSSSTPTSGDVTGGSSGAPGGASPPPGQPPQEKVFVQASDISIPPPEASFISSSSLVDQLVRNQDDTLRFLSEQIAPIDVSDISVDQHGSVVINNQQFRETLLVMLATAAPESANGLCGNVKCVMD